MSRDEFVVGGDEVFYPARLADAITPSDTAVLPTLPKAIYVGGAGNITLRAVDSTADVVLNGVLAGSTIPVRAQFIRATGTTATGLVGLA
jgi:hypothetical protein